MEQKKFEWPEFNSDKDRIKHNTQAYSQLSIADAFNSAYKLKIKPTEISDEVPRDLRVGDIIKVFIRDVQKNHVEFDSTNVKADLSSSVNLWKYNRFKNNIPKESVDARVTNISRGTTYIDPLALLTEGYVLPFVKDPWKQKDLKAPHKILVKNLQLSRGGFIGQAVIPSTSGFVGEDYTVEAFIPGSQIVLNITKDFEDFIGQDVEAFIVNYMPKPGADNKMSLICSVKELLKFYGDSTMVEMFKHWSESDEVWQETENARFAGVVTGIINSSKKCGVFVEIPELNITGMVQCKPSEIVNYKPGDELMVGIEGFEEETFYNKDVQQVQHLDPYIITEGCLVKCNLKPVLRFC